MRPRNDLLCVGGTLNLTKLKLKSASSSHHQQASSIQSHQQTIGEDYVWNAEK